MRAGIVAVVQNSLVRTTGFLQRIAEDGQGTAHAAWGVSAQRMGGREIWHCAIRLLPQEGRGR